MVHILHIDTSGEVGTVTIAGDGQVLHSRANPDTRNQAASVNIMINEVLHDAGITLQEIDAICVCAGPGSYTGLRIGMATAKALCYVLDKPLLLDNKLTLLAYNQYHKHLSEYDVYISVLTAREGEYFISSHDNNFNPVVSPRHVLEADVPTLDTWKTRNLVVGTFKESILNDLNTSNLKIISTGTIDLSSWALYTLDQYHCNRNVNLSTSEPFYLKQVFTHKKKDIN